MTTVLFGGLSQYQGFYAYNRWWMKIPPKVMVDGSTVMWNAVDMDDDGIGTWFDDTVEVEIQF